MNSQNKISTKLMRLISQFSTLSYQFVNTVTVHSSIQQIQKHIFSILFSLSSTLTYFFFYMNMMANKKKHPPTKATLLSKSTTTTPTDLLRRASTTTSSSPSTPLHSTRHLTTTTKTCNIKSSKFIVYVCCLVGFWIVGAAAAVAAVYGPRPRPNIFSLHCSRARARSYFIFFVDQIYTKIARSQFTKRQQSDIKSPPSNMFIGIIEGGVAPFQLSVPCPCVTFFCVVSVCLQECRPLQMPSVYSSEIWCYPCVFRVPHRHHHHHHHRNRKPALDFCMFNSFGAPTSRLNFLQQQTYRWVIYDDYNDDDDD